MPASPTQDARLIAVSYYLDGSIADIEVRTLSKDADAVQTVEDLAPAARYKAFLLQSGTPAPMYHSGQGVAAYEDFVTAKGQVYVPVLDGAVAHAASMAVDAYVEATTAKENVMSYFSDTGSTYTYEGESGKINRIARLAESGSDAEKAAAMNKIETALSAMEQALGAAAVLDAAAEKDIVQTQAAVAQTVSLMASSKEREAIQWA